MTEPRGRMKAFLRGRSDSGEGITPAMRAVLEAASPGLALLDAEDRILAWNPELGRLCGPSLPLRAGMAAAALIEPELRGSTIAALAAGRAAEAALSAAGTPRVRIERRDLPLRESVALLRVTSLAAAEDSQRNDAAARLQAVGALAGGIAHDFNNLLAAIGGSAEAALARDATGLAADDLRQIMASAARGAGLVRQLLAFARQQPMRPRVVELNEAVAAIGEMLRRLLGRGVHLDLALGEPARQVFMDPTQLDQVIVNLALNARDAMPEGGSLRIATSHALVLRPEPIGQEELPPGRYATVEVSDTGGGIPPEVLPRIFEPFFTTKRERGGTGLGLSTVHGIVRQSGGYIAVTSRVGQGTTFRIWLPRHERERESAPSADIAAPAPVSAPVAAGGPVLLVEDEPPLLRLAERALRNSGFEVLSAPSGEEALEMLDASAANPVALVTDMVMPGIDGLALAAKLRERDPSLPVLLVSGYAEAALGRDLAAEAVRLLPKPYRLADLIAEVRSLLTVATARVS